MATYIIGDVQGCFKELTQLLANIKYDQDNDELCFAGDLVNRGPESLAVLRFAKSIDAKIVLGNHDLHLLAQYYTKQNKYSHKNDTLTQVLSAPDAEELLSWLRHQPLLRYFTEHATFLVHAGILPTWSRQQALDYAQEVHLALSGDNHQNYLQHLYGNQPDKWSESLQGFERFRCLVNIFTRMRTINKKTNALNLYFSGGLNDCPENHQPWFFQPTKTTQIIVFGHWSALNGITNIKNRIATDTGAVWGGKLSAHHLGTINNKLC